MEELGDGGRPTEDDGSKEAPDLISNLPDAVISSILSLLTLKEAAATSVLSRRWKYSWTSFPWLVFDREVFPGMKRDAFVKLVDYVVNLYHPKGVTLQEFCVHFSPNESSMSHIDNWLDFALPRAARVDVDFDHKSYAVPIEVFLRPSTTNGSDSTGSILAAETVPHPTPQNHFTSLRELFLSRTHVTDKVFEAILSTCASLECFVVTYDRLLRSARCIVPHLKLKHMTIQTKNMVDLEIIAPNLVSFNYSGPRANLCIQGAQSLASVVILSQDKQKDFLFGPLSANISQLECLTLDTGSVLGRIAHNKVPSLSNLRTVSLADIYVTQNNLSLLLCHRSALCLLDACPLLQRFELHLGFYPYAYDEEGELLVDKRENNRHKNLKELMLTGFRGYNCEIDFAVLIARRAAALERVEVSSRNYSYMVNRQGSYNWVTFLRDAFGIKEDVEKLRSMLPSNVCVKYFDD